MESRRGTMSSPSGTFSHIAHEALDHLVADGTHEDRNPHSIAYQPSRRRPKVSEKNPSPNIHSFTSHCLDRISSEEKGEKKARSNVKDNYYYFIRNICLRLKSIERLNNPSLSDGHVRFVFGE